MYILQKQSKELWETEFRKLLQGDSPDIEAINRHLYDELDVDYLNQTVMPIILQQFEQHVYTLEKICKIVEILVERGININCEDRIGRNALLILCESYGNEDLFEIVRLLVKKGIDVNCKTNDGRNALLVLCDS